jgi:hypothetical protein
MSMSIEELLASCELRPEHCLDSQFFRRADPFCRTATATATATTATYPTKAQYSCDICGEGDAASACRGRCTRFVCDNCTSDDDDDDDTAGVCVVCAGTASEQDLIGLRRGDTRLIVVCIEPERSAWWDAACGFELAQSVLQSLGHHGHVLFYTMRAAGRRACWARKLQLVRHLAARASPLVRADWNVERCCIALVLATHSTAAGAADAERQFHYGERQRAALDDWLRLVEENALPESGATNYVMATKLVVLNSCSVLGGSAESRDQTLQTLQQFVDRSGGVEMCLTLESAAPRPQVTACLAHALELVARGRPIGPPPAVPVVVQRGQRVALLGRAQFDTLRVRSRNAATAGELAAVVRQFARPAVAAAITADADTDAQAQAQQDLRARVRARAAWHAVVKPAMLWRELLSRWPDAFPSETSPCNAHRLMSLLDCSVLLCRLAVVSGSKRGEFRAQLAAKLRQEQLRPANLDGRLRLLCVRLQGAREMLCEFEAMLVAGLVEPPSMAYLFKLIPAEVMADDVRRALRQAWAALHPPNKD